MHTTQIEGSEGRILAPFGSPDRLIEGKRICICITGYSTNPNVPALVNEGLLDLCVDAVFTQDQVARHGSAKFKALPADCLLAFASEMVEMLESMSRYAVAESLHRYLPGPFDLYVLEAGTFRVVD